MEDSWDELNKLKSVDLVTLQRRIAQALSDLVHEDYSVSISKIEYHNLLTTKVEMEITLKTTFLGKKTE